MNIFVRYLLWILIAALPLQGGAVAFMSCGSGSGQTQSSSHHEDENATDVHADTHHEDETAIAVHLDAHHEHCDDGDSVHAGSPHGKCSHCASCCIGAAAPPAIPSEVFPTNFTTFATAAVEPSMTAYIPATLERPPRRHS